MDPVVGTVLLVMLLTAGTKTGRGAVRNAATSAYKATGWRRPRAAIVHHSGRAGAKVGGAFATAARTTRSKATQTAERRWTERVGSADPPGSHPPLRLIKPATTTPSANPSANSSAAAGVGGPPPSFGKPTTPAPNTRTPRADDQRPSDRRGPGRWSGPPDVIRYGPFTSTVVHDNDIYTLKPANNTGERSPVPDPPATDPTTDTGARTSGTAATPRRTMTANNSRYRVEFEKPTTDAEFLESCLTLADLLRQLAKSVEEWAGDVASLGLPQQVTAPLNAVAEGIGDAATAVNRAATTFADLFEESREIAARGMKFTGEDAA